MPKRALSERRPYLLAACAVALVFLYLRAGPWPELWIIPLKGAALVLLALYAFLRHSSLDARLLGVMMLVAAVGATAFEFDRTAGQIVFFGYHVIALTLYLRNRRGAMTGSQKGAVAALLVLPIMILAVMGSLTGAGFVVFAYGGAVGAMAAGAWASSFPRYRVGAGAVLVLAAALFNFASIGPLQAISVPQILSWPLAFIGQFLICTGVIQTLRRRDLGPT